MLPSLLSRLAVAVLLHMPLVCSMEEELALSTNELLAPAFQAFMAGVQIAGVSSFIVDGDVRVGQQDTPKMPLTAVELAASDSPQSTLPLDLVVTASPTPDATARFTYRVDLSGAHFGVNRLHAFVYVHRRQCAQVNASYTAPWCESYMAPEEEIISARLAPARAATDPAQSLRWLQLRTANFAMMPGEWHEVLGDFYLLPEEYGSGSGRIKLFVTVGSEQSRQGRVSITDLTVTPLPLVNVAFSKRVADEASDVSMISAGFYEPPPNSILTDGILIGQPWYAQFSRLAVPPLHQGYTRWVASPDHLWAIHVLAACVCRYQIDQPPIDPVKFSFDLSGALHAVYVRCICRRHTNAWIGAGTYYVCSLRVEFLSSSSQVSDFELSLSPLRGPFTDIGTNFTTVFQFADNTWTDWASNRNANPTSTNQRWFDCTTAARARLQLTNTQNSTAPVSILIWTVPFSVPCQGTGA